jgi:hypothetical protein
MKTIYKFELKITESQQVETNRGMKPLSVQCIDDKVFLWGMVDTEANKTSYNVRIYGTGHKLSLADREDSGSYVGTVQQFNGKLVWHVFV